MPAGSSHLSSPRRFLWHYLRLRSWRFAALLGLVMGGVTCSVGAQYTMKLLVDALTSPARDMSAVMIALGLFIVLIGIDSVAFRLAGWLACNTVVATGIDVRTDLFDHLTGHSMGYFASQFVGALGSRITATTGAVGALISAFTWTIIPPLTDFAGALVVLATIDWRMPIALTLFVILASLGVAWFGEKGRPLHQAYSRQAAKVAGEIVDTVSNAWAVKAFAARFRERQRLARLFDDEALWQRRSWMHLEKTRALHDLLLWILASSMLVWSIRLWTLGTVTAGDVLVTSALTFRILHG